MNLTKFHTLIEQCWAHLFYSLTRLDGVPHAAPKVLKGNKPPKVWKTVIEKSVMPNATSAELCSDDSKQGFTSDLEITQPVLLLSQRNPSLQAYSSL